MAQLWEDIIDPMLCILMVLRLKILFNLLFGGKCLLRNLKNTLPMFVFKFLEKSGLNHMNFLFLFFLVSVSAFLPGVFEYFRL